jgi:hypothetical protein
VYAEQWVFRVGVMRDGCVEVMGCMYMFGVCVGGRCCTVPGVSELSGP